MSMNKLHPIYVALDAHQYNRAIKLASALPETNVLGKALLAHAYCKSGQRYLSLLTLYRLLTNAAGGSTTTTGPGNNNSNKNSNYFCELKHEVEYSLEAQQEGLLTQQQQQQQQSSTSSNDAPAPAPSSSKKGKKGKKGKPSTSSGNKSSSTQTSSSAASSSSGPGSTTTTTNTTTKDLIDQLNIPPTLPENWEVLPPSDKAITDETILATLSVSLQSLKLPLTAYQVFSWASTLEPTEATLTKTFCLGLSVLATPSKWDTTSCTKIAIYVLAHIQTIALSWARWVVAQQKKTVNSNNNNGGNATTTMMMSTSDAQTISLATAWAAQSALWQLQWLPPDDKRSMILPRLAESMARKLLQQSGGGGGGGGDGNDDGQFQPAETQLLCLRILEEQSKWSDMLEILDTLPVPREEQQQQPQDEEGLSTTAVPPPPPPPPPRPQSEFGVALTTYQILTEKARVLQELNQYEAAREVYERLLRTNPDDWSCWKGHLNCCIKEGEKEGSTTSTTLLTTKLVESTLKICESKSKYPLRGPHLMKVELALYRYHHAAAAAAAAVTRDDNANNDTNVDTVVRELIQSIQTYSQLFAPRASCAFSDIERYLEEILLYLSNSGNDDNDDTNDDDATTKQNKTRELMELLLKFIDTMKKENSTTMTTNDDDNKNENNDDNKTRQSKLRAYIFAIKMNYKILSPIIITKSKTSSSSTESSSSSSWLSLQSSLRDEYLINGLELVKEWKATLSLTSSNEGEETQKELKPGDELVLLAAQYMMYSCHDDAGTSTDTATAKSVIYKGDKSALRIACAALLESAIVHSPDNAYLKLAAINVYYQLNAMSRAWDLYQSIGLKHIQLDSCTYVILPFLMEGGLYNETIEVCKTMLRFQSSTARDCGDYAGRAMEAGTLSKANEFMIFQREKMNKSLSILQAKGYILDAAALLANIVPRKKHDEDPIYKGGIGILQGIVGGDDDMGRATQMVMEVHNPNAALSVVALANQYGIHDDDGANVDVDTVMNDVESLADNRDMSIYFNQLLYKTKVYEKKSIFYDTIRRGHIHGILISATLCLDAVKGPKKGKIVKNSTELEKRTKSLLRKVSGLHNFVQQQQTRTTTKTHPLLSTNIEEGNTNMEQICKSLLEASLSLCQVLAMIGAGASATNPNTTVGTGTIPDSMEYREENACKILSESGIEHLKNVRTYSKDGSIGGTVTSSTSTAATTTKTKTVTCDYSGKDVCFLLSNYIIPLYGLFRMTSKVCTIYGWSVRKRYTKRCAGTIADFAIQFNMILQDLLDSLKRLPDSEESRKMTIYHIIPDEYRTSLVEQNTMYETIDMITKAQYRTRVRVEPVLQEMDEYLDTFDIPETTNG